MAAGPPRLLLVSPGARGGANDGLDVGRDYGELGPVVPRPVATHDDGASLRTVGRRLGHSILGVPARSDSLEKAPAGPHAREVLTRLIACTTWRFALPHGRS